MEKIEETYNIVKDSNEFKSNGNHIDSNALVSMNIWGFKKDVFNSLAPSWQLLYPF